MAHMGRTGSALEMCGMRSVAWIVLGLALMSAMPSAAEARSRGGPSSEYYEWQSQHRGPAHGYSGWMPGGRRGL